MAMSPCPCHYAHVIMPMSLCLCHYVYVIMSMPSCPCHYVHVIISFYFFFRMVSTEGIASGNSGRRGKAGKWKSFGFCRSQSRRGIGEQKRSERVSRVMAVTEEEPLGCCDDAAGMLRECCGDAAGMLRRRCDRRKMIGGDDCSMSPSVFRLNRRKAPGNGMAR